MPRRRMISPDLWSDERFGDLSPYAKLLWIALISLADDEGRGSLNVKKLRKDVFGYEEKMSLARMAKVIDEIGAKMRSFARYTVEGEEYYNLRKWSTYQTINRPSESILPAPPDSLNDHGVITERSLNDHGTITDDSHPSEAKRSEVNRSKAKGDSRKDAKAQRAGIEDVTAIILGRWYPEKRNDTGWQDWVATALRERGGISTARTLANCRGNTPEPWNSPWKCGDDNIPRRLIGSMQAPAEAKADHTCQRCQADAWVMADQQTGDSLTLECFVCGRGFEVDQIGEINTTTKGAMRHDSAGDRSRT